MHAHTHIHICIIAMLCYYVRLLCTLLCWGLVLLAQRPPSATANLRTKILDFSGFYSSRILK